MNTKAKPVGYIELPGTPAEKLTNPAVGVTTSPENPVAVTTTETVIISGLKGSYTSIHEFEFGTVWDFAQSMGRKLDGAEIVAMVSRERARGNDLYWANIRSTVIYGAGYEAHREADAARRAAAKRLVVGDYVKLRGVVLRIDPAPNGNVRLVEVEDVVEMSRRGVL